MNDYYYKGNGNTFMSSDDEDITTNGSDNKKIDHNLVKDIY